MGGPVNGSAAARNRRRTRRLVVETILWLAFAVGTWIATYFAIPESTMFRWGEELWPRAIILLIFGITGLRFLFEYFVFGVSEELPRLRSEAPEGAANGQSLRHGLSARLRLVGTFLLPFVYLFLLPRMGFFVLTPFFLAGCMFLFGERRLRHLVGTTLGVYAVVLLLFSHFLFVPLPTGYWPGFYDFSNWLLKMIA